MEKHEKKRLASSERVALIASGVVVAFVAILFGAFWRGKPGTSATLKPAPTVVQGFTLEDQKGHMFNLAADRGKVIVLAFLYTHCTDECPFIAEKFKLAYAGLTAAERREVDFVVVSADPVGDTLKTAAAYSNEFGMYDAWHYLIGTRKELSPIWSYYERMLPSGDATGAHGSEFHPEVGLNTISLDAAQSAISKFGGGPDIDHPTTVWLFDRQHQLNTTLSFEVFPSDLIADIRTLIHD